MLKRTRLSVILIILIIINQCCDIVSYLIQLHFTYGAGNYVANHTSKTKSKGGPKVPPQEVHPGTESYRRVREEATRYEDRWI